MNCISTDSFFLFCVLQFLRGKLNNGKYIISNYVGVHGLV